MFLRAQELNHPSIAARRFHEAAEAAVHRDGQTQKTHSRLRIVVGRCSSERTEARKGRASVENKLGAQRRNRPKLAAIGRISTATPIKPNGTAEAAPRRVPRILSAPTPEREIVPVDKPRRGPGRPRKHLLMDETLPDKPAPNTVSKTDAERIKTEKNAKATALPVSPSPKGSAKNDGEHTKTSAPSPVESDRIIHERRSPGSTRRSRRRAAADASLKRGDRWKRHLPPLVALGRRPRIQDTCDQLVHRAFSSAKKR